MSSISLLRVIMLTLIITLLLCPTANTMSVSAQATTVTYVVQPGDHLYTIALRFGTTWQAIASYNHLTNPNLIYAGQVLLIPVSGSSSIPSPTYYTVQRGDTLRRIASRFGTTWQILAQINHIVNPNLIYSGQVLQITGTTQPPSPPRQYTVQQGDTLMRISLRFGISMWDIARVNRILNLNRIYVGQVLIIPFI